MFYSLSRAGFLSALAGALFAFAAPGAHATANPEAEAYVQQGGGAALASLSNPSLSRDARGREFAELMARFADAPRIANFVLGRYGAALRADPALNAQWVSTFQAYMIAVYEDNLDRYRGSTLAVTGSIERVPGRDAVVRSELRGVNGGGTQPMQWRLLKTAAGWKVVDVSLVLDGNEVWLAQQQQRNFLAELDRNRGDVRALIESVRQTTTQLRTRIAARP
ncbi:MAG: phospholipid-binding protein MlaC [Hyphomonadaceae bacterium]